MITNMIVLCEDFDEVYYAFSNFMEFLETYDSFMISKVYEFGYAVETVEEIRYIFLDQHLEQLFRNKGFTEFIDRSEFFDGIEQYYYRDYDVDDVHYIYLN